MPETPGNSALNAESLRRAASGHVRAAKQATPENSAPTAANQNPDA